MPGITDQFGKYNADGIKGGQAVAHQLDKLITYFASPVDSVRGFGARLRYVLKSGRSLAEARAAGFTVRGETIEKWQKGTQKPSRASLAQLDRAYRAMRRAHAAPALLRRLEAGGGTRIEIHPVDQSRVTSAHRRTVTVRTVNVRHWARFVDPWAAGDDASMNDAWIDEITDDIGSEWGAYEYVTTVGFAA